MHTTRCILTINGYESSPIANITMLSIMIAGDLVLQLTNIIKIICGSSVGL